jgi:mono/diheme cytochrome c family protein
MSLRAQLAASLLLAGAAALPIVPGAVRADDAAAITTESPDLTTTSGAEIYAHICRGCHMAGGTGAQGAGYYPKLAGDPKLVSWEYAAVTVLRGRKAMPAFGLSNDLPGPMHEVHLSDAQIAAVVNYVRTSFGNHWKNSVTAADVAKLPHPTESRVAGD